MFALDPSPWLLLTVPFVAVASYVCHRGFTRNAFRERGKWGWVTYASGSFEWYLSTGINLLFLGCGLYLLYMTIFDGTAFEREPVLAMPALSGTPVETLSVARAPEALARCLAEVDHGKIYSSGAGSWRVAVRNGRNAVMYLYEITPAEGGSRLDVYRQLPSPFVDWNRCSRAG